MIPFKFRALRNSDARPTFGKSCAYLWADNWNDWYKYRTTFELTIFDEEGNRHVAGEVKIGFEGMPPNHEGDGRPRLPETFAELENGWFSLGTNESYYETIAALPEPLPQTIFERLRDVAYDINLFNAYEEEDVMQESLLRYVTSSTVRHRFASMARGKAQLTAFNFSYRSPGSAGFAEFRLEFDVTPRATPPTNVHIIIGRNGVGKTRLLRSMADAAATDSTEEGGFELSIDGEPDRFSAVVLVSFSAFDPFAPIKNEPDGRTRFHYVGMKKVVHHEDGEGVATKTEDDLKDDFVRSAIECRRVEARARRWRNALDALRTDPIFESANAEQLVDCADVELKGRVEALFKRLSTGHKVVLLGVTGIVQAVDERSLVLFDEPEAHLHPPLTSSYIRCISELLVERNAVAVIATHTPVILQEVPSCAVTILHRVGRITQVERPVYETFGESTGRLTTEVFGLEARRSGFYALLKRAAEEASSYEEALARFDGQLGDEGRAILRGLTFPGSTD